MASLPGRAALLGTLYLAGVGGLTILSTVAGSAQSAVRTSLAFVIIALLPGSAVAVAVMRRASGAHILVVGSILGLGLLSAGGMLSHLVGTSVVRWVPSVIGTAVGIFLIVRRHPVRRPSAPRPVMLGALAGFVILLPSTVTAFISQPMDWSGWFRFHSDVPFQVAITAEVAARAPAEMPWVAGTELSYPWMFHSAMGTWATASGVPAVEVVFQAWPVLIAAVLPAAIALVAWEITRNSWVAIASPAVFALAHGIIPADGLLAQIPLITVSPTRDYANLFILLTLLALSRVLGRPTTRALSPGWLIILSIAAFVGAGAKGSALPLMLGGVLLALFMQVVLRRLRRPDLLAFATFAIASTAGFIATVPVRGPNDSVALGALSFLPAETPQRLALSLVLVLLLAGSALGAWAVTAGARRRSTVDAALLAGVVIAGLLGLAALTHPSGSQLYFWQNAQPALAILLAWAVALLVGHHGRVAVAAGALTLLLTSVAASTPAPPWLVGVGLGAVAAVLAAVMVIRQRPRTGGGLRTLLAWAGIAGVLIQAGQIISVPEGRPAGSDSDASVVAAIHSSQREALQYIEAHADPYDLVASNRHCFYSEVVDDECDGRWFATAAWSERRVLVDGWAYTANGAGRGWVRERIELSDGFIESPTSAERDALSAAGVRWVYVDTRLPYAVELAEFAELVFEGEFARVYRLR